MSAACKARSFARDLKCTQRKHCKLKQTAKQTFCGCVPREIKVPLWDIDQELSTLDCKLKRFNCDAKAPCADNCALLCRLRLMKDELCNIKRKLRCIKKSICRARCPPPNPCKPRRSRCPDPCDPCTSFPPSEVCCDEPPPPDPCDPCTPPPDPCADPCRSDATRQQTAGRNTPIVDDYCQTEGETDCDPCRDAGPAGDDARGNETSGADPCDPCADVDPCADPCGDDPCADEPCEDDFPPCGLCAGDDPCSQYREKEGFSNKVQYLQCRMTSCLDPTLDEIERLGKCLDSKLKRHHAARTDKKRKQSDNEDPCANDYGQEEPCDPCEESSNDYAVGSQQQGSQQQTEQYAQDNTVDDHGSHAGASVGHTTTESVVSSRRQRHSRRSEDPYKGSSYKGSTRGGPSRKSFSTRRTSVGSEVTN